MVEFLGTTASAVIPFFAVVNTILFFALEYLKRVIIVLELGVAHHIRLFLRNFCLTVAHLNRAALQEVHSKVHVSLNIMQELIVD